MLRRIRPRELTVPALGRFKAHKRCYKVLSIETSCDDTCVALIDRPQDTNEPSCPPSRPVVIDHLKKTLNSTTDGGVIPIKAHLHHQRSLAPLVREICKKHGIGPQNPPDLVCVTRGPGMPGCLTVGLEVAKGLAAAWSRPLVGVHHMLGHLLISRLQCKGQSGSPPQFPFLSLLVSGGHTILVYSKSVLEHEILAETIDIAAGDSLDKCARVIGMQGVMLGKELEQFVFSNVSGSEALSKSVNEYEAQLKKNPDFALMDLPNPLRNKTGRVNLLAFSFAPFITAVKTSLEKYHCNDINNMTLSKRKLIGYQIQTAIFQHITDKIKTALEVHKGKLEGVKDFVCSGGVGSSKLLKKMLQDQLGSNPNSAGKVSIEKFHFPEPALCTDNAIMIGWAGIELWESAKLYTDLNEGLPVRKWPLNHILGVDGWVNRS